MKVPDGDSGGDSVGGPVGGYVELRPPRAPISGRVVLPGSKSVTNRALLLAALARGDSRLSGALKSDDTKRMSEGLRAMGVCVTEPDTTTFLVRSPGALSRPPATLHLGNAGTAMRFLTAAAGLVSGDVTLDGDLAMRLRPIGPLVSALAQLGVRADAQTGCPPVVVHGQGGLTGERAEVDAALSSQYASALLMIAPFGSRPVVVALRGKAIGARGYIDLTLTTMGRFGAQVDTLEGGQSWRVHPTGYHAAQLEVEPDASAATYFWAAGALTRGGVDVGRDAASFSQPDARAFDLIQAFPDMPAVIDGSQIQDAVPTLAVLAAFNRNPVRFTGIANLRVKECDRISALSEQLSRIHPGLARQREDDLIVNGDPDLRSPRSPVELQTYDDHRMAMSLALCGLRLENIRICDPGCTAKTYPGYWDALSGLGVELGFSAA